MPYRRSYRRKSAFRRRPVFRRRAIRRVRRKAFRPQLLSGAIGYPRQQKIRMRYVDNFRNNVMTGGAMVNYRFRANGLFDPNQTGTGHQPACFDTWSGLYNHYKVLGSKITATIGAATSAALLAPVMCVAFTSDDTTTYTDYTTMQEMGRGQARSLVPNTQGQVRVVAKFSGRKWFGEKWYGDTTQALISADPSDECIFNIALQPTDQLSTVSADTITINIQIDYIVVFTEPRDLAAS